MKVRIREWGELAEEFGIDEDGDIDCYCSFTIEMKDYCGKVIEVNDDEVFTCDDDDIKTFEYHGWFFSEDMYEVIEE